MNETIDKMLLAMLVGLPALYGGNWLLTTGFFSRLATPIQGKATEPASASSQRLRLLDEARDLYDQAPVECRAPLETVMLSLLRTNEANAPKTEVLS